MTGSITRSFFNECMWIYIYITDLPSRFTKAPLDNFKFGGNLNYFTLCLTDKLTMANFFTLPPNVLLSEALNFKYIF